MATGKPVVFIVTPLLEGRVFAAAAVTSAIVDPIAGTVFTLLRLGRLPPACVVDLCFGGSGVT